MQLPNQHPRINLIELKAQLIQRFGPERSKQYFHFLNKLLSLKLSKVEFNKVCFLVLGRENVRLHNLLICSILKNACNAKVPPPPGTIHESLQTGEVLLSPQKARSGASIRLIAKTGSSSHESTITNDVVVSENWDTTSRDIQKPLQHHQEISGKANNGRDALLPNPEIKGSFNGFPSEDGRDQSEMLFVEDGKETYARSSLQAPPGVPLFSRGTRRSFRLASSTRYAKSYDIGGLLDAESLREHIQQIAAQEGLEGTRHGCSLRKNNTMKHHSRRNLVNSVSTSRHKQIQNNSWCLEAIDEHRYYKLVSLLDFKLNPQRLGEDRQY
ncbi:putative Glucose-6-phosphate 1-epimerase [Hibiscus syriacus]|uniref:Glucose-6-phosphate 1-epimerase n=1 Tax=Hibiscus syriacus TaxID=106335 RepID=A0A6A2WK52_HIBSY|nr:putative Glucose-6-phosphate 1-epimerase [Hibiscus syriacus]